MYWKVIMLGYMRVISYILLNMSDQLEINASPNEAPRHGLKKPHLPCQSSLFTHKNKVWSPHPPINPRTYVELVLMENDQYNLT